ncbi:MAG: hypothetical protein AAGE03_03415 [Pseudomonadota bacterium]
MRLLFAALLTATPAAAQVGAPQQPQADITAPACDYLDRDPNSCSRVLACIGDDGLWFDGQARGWGSGTVSGRISDGTLCEGTWAYETRGSTARSNLVCEDGVEIGVLYTQQDPATGTGIGSGLDSRGREIMAWSGAHLLRFLTPEGDLKARLQCGDAPIPIS